MLKTSDILAKVRKIEIKTRKLMTSVLLGEYHSAFKGTGMEFAEVRQYMPGDDIRAIDWNVTARTGTAHVKKFRESRELSVILLIDVSASHNLGSQDQSKRELITEVAALLSFSAMLNNDRVGVLLVTDHVEKFIAPRKGRKHVLAMISELLAFEPQSRGTSLQAGFAYLMTAVKKKSVVFVLSDFIDRNFIDAMALAGSKHDCVPVVIRDPRESMLPSAGRVTLRDAETGKLHYLDMRKPKVREAYQVLAGQELEELKKGFALRGIRPIWLRAGEDYVKPIMKHFIQKGKRN